MRNGGELDREGLKWRCVGGEYRQDSVEYFNHRGTTCIHERGYLDF